MANETVEEMEILRHMLGVGSHIRKKDWGSRNYFNAGIGHSDMPTLHRLIDKGLVIGGLPEYFHATDAGYAAIGLKPPKPTSRSGGTEPCGE